MTVATLKTVDLSRTPDVGPPRTFSQRATTLRSSRDAQDSYAGSRLKHYSYVDPEADDSQKLIVVTEAYIRLDINEDGIGELCKVTVIGESTPTDILDIEEVAEIPFVAMQAIPKPHSFYGVSVFERVQAIQDLKTAVLRSTLDSFYQNTNKMKVVQEGQVNLDDLLVSRPGGIIRAKGHNAVMEIGGTPMGQEAFQLLQFADEQKRSTGRCPPTWPDRTSSSTMSQRTQLNV